MFEDPDVRFVAVNTASWDAHKQGAQPVVGDAKVSLEAIDAVLGTYAAPPEWLAMADEQIAEWHAYLDSWSGPTHDGPPAYAEVIQAINAVADPEDYILSAAGGLPGELTHGLALEVGSARSTPSTAIRRWATRSPARGARGSPARRATSSRGSATART